MSSFLMKFSAKVTSLGILIFCEIWLCIEPNLKRPKFSPQNCLKITFAKGPTSYAKSPTNHSTALIDNSSAIYHL